jgi:hypothetical protein
MALREYINDTRGVSELEWMFGKQDADALEAMQDSIPGRPKRDASSNTGTTPEKATG